MLTTGFQADIELPAQWTLAAVASANSTGRVILLRSDSGGGVSNPISLAASETKSVGPFTRQASCRVVCHTGTVTYSIHPSYLGDVTNIVQSTQAAYDALSPPDASTLYLIVG